MQVARVCGGDGRLRNEVGSETDDTPGLAHDEQVVVDPGDAGHAAVERGRDREPGALVGVRVDGARGQARGRTRIAERDENSHAGG